MSNTVESLDFWWLKFRGIRGYFSSTNLNDSTVPNIHFVWGCQQNNLIFSCIPEIFLSRISISVRKKLFWVAPDVPSKIQTTIIHI